jgi:hypothetical protein
MSNELEPCPFCGEQVKQPVSRPSSNDKRDGFVAFLACYCGGYSATAHRMGSGENERDAVRDVIAKWNNRAQPAAPVTTPEPVKLPERKHHKCHGLTALDIECDGWNACLDAVEKLGPLYTHGRKGLVERLLSEIERLNRELRAHADASEVERLRVENKRLWTAYSDQQDKRIAAEGERDNARAQLAELGALLRDARSDMQIWCDKHPDEAPLTKHLIRTIDAALSARAEPIAPKYPISHGAHITQFHDETFVWYDEAGLQGGVTYSLGQAQLAVAWHGKQLNGGAQ